MNERVEVREYSGGRAGQRPLEVFIDGQWVYVMLVSTWVEEDLHTRRRSRHFIVRDQDRRIFHLFQDQDGQWFISGSPSEGQEVNQDRRYGE